MRARGLPVPWTGSPYALSILILGLLVGLTLLGPVRALAEGGVTVVVMTYPERYPLIVDGVIYTPGPGGGAYTFHWAPGSVHTIALLRSEYYTGPGSRLVFSTWNTGDTGSSIVVSPESDSSYVALYEPFYYVNAQSGYAAASGTGWYRAGDTAVLSVPPVVSLGNGTRAVFAGWSGGSTPEMPENPVPVLGPVSLRAEWRVEHLLILRSSSGGAILMGGGWHGEGEKVTIEAPLEVPGGPGTVYRFRGWTVSWGSALIENPTERETVLVMGGPAVVTALYDAYHEVKVLGLPGGDVVKLARENDTFTYILDKLAIQKGPDSRLVFAGWSNGEKGPSLSFTVVGPTTVTALWRAEYRVAIGKGPVPVEGAGWYMAGDTATIRAPQTYSARLGARYVFDHWEGDASGSNNSVSVRVDGPMKLEPVYRKDYSRTILGAVGAVVAVAGMLGGYRALSSLLSSRRPDESPAE